MLDLHTVLKELRLKCDIQHETVRLSLIPPPPLQHNLQPNPSRPISSLKVIFNLHSAHIYVTVRVWSIAGNDSALFTLHFKSFILLIFPSLFVPLSFFLSLCAPVFLVVPYGLWFADRAGRQRSWRVAWDKSCFSALRADTSRLCSLQIAEICRLGVWGEG